MPTSEAQRGADPAASLFDLDNHTDRLWRDEELGAILRHQMGAPLQVDLINLERGLAVKVRNSGEPA